MIFVLSNSQEKELGDVLFLFWRRENAGTQGPRNDWTVLLRVRNLVLLNPPSAPSPRERVWEQEEAHEV